MVANINGPSHAQAAPGVASDPTVERAAKQLRVLVPWIRFDAEGTAKAMREHVHSVVRPGSRADAEALLREFCSSVSLEAAMAMDIPTRFVNMKAVFLVVKSRVEEASLAAQDQLAAPVNRQPIPRPTPRPSIADPSVAATEIASLRAKVAQLEAELARLRLPEQYVGRDAPVMGAEVGAVAPVAAIGDASRITLFVRPLCGSSFEINISTTETVADLKQAIQLKEGIPPDQLRLIYAGRLLEDDFSLHHYGISSGSWIHGVLKLCGD